MQRFCWNWNVLRSVSLACIILASSVALPQFRAMAEESVTPSIKEAPATHKQKLVITAANAKAGEKLEDFCTDLDGRILALLGPTEAPQGGAIDFLGGLFGGTVTPKKAPKFAPAVHVFDADGKLIEKWPVGFTGQAIATAPDGTVLIGGNGRVARFDSHGKKLIEAESPQMTYINNNQEEMKARAKDQLESDRETFATQVKEFEEQLAELKKAKKEGGAQDKKKESSNGEEETGLGNEQNLKQLVQAYQQHLKYLEKRLYSGMCG